MNVTIHIDGSVTVVDNGRGIPVDQHASGKSAAEVVLTVLHAGGKFDNDSYKVSGGLHGVGVSVVNALSETLDLEIWRERPGLPADLRARPPDRRPRGHRHDASAAAPRSRSSRTREIFETTVFSFDTLAQRLRELAFLNGGILITLDDERDGKSHKFHYDGGIVSFVHASRTRTRRPSTRSRSTCGARRTASRPRSPCSGTTATRRRSIPSRTTSTRTRAARTSRASARR